MEIQRYYIPINRLLSILFFCVLFSLKTEAQIDFRDSTFEVRVMDSVYYGSAKNFGGAETQLYLDIYLPKDLDDYERPLIVFAHGGSFLSGNRKSPDLVILCNELASRGYICASIDYRKGINVLRDFKDEFAKAVWRAVQDERTAMRFFRSSYAEGNPYHIDTNQMYLAGVSAGSIAALHAAFQTDTSEIPSTINTSSLGGLYAGDHGSYSSHFKGIINLFGAISEKDYIDFPPDIQQCHLHGSSDQTVPYKSDTYAPNNIEIGILHGSYVIDSISKSLGMNSTLKTLWNKGHVPYTRDSSYIDTTLNFIVDCMFDKVTLGKKVGVQQFDELGQIRFWQNEGYLYLEKSFDTEGEIEIYNSTGARIYKQVILTNHERIKLATKLQGPHIVKLRSGSQMYIRKIWFQ